MKTGRRATGEVMVAAGAVTGRGRGNGTGAASGARRGGARSGAAGLRAEAAGARTGGGVGRRMQGGVAAAPAESVRAAWDAAAAATRGSGGDE